MIACIFTSFTSSATAASGFVKRVDADSGNAPTELANGYIADGSRDWDWYYAEFETTYNGKSYITFCREHEPIDSPGFGGVNCDVQPGDKTSDMAICMYYYGIGKNWKEGSTNRLRLSRLASYINGHPCMPYKESVMREWVAEAKREVKRIPASANFEIYLIKPNHATEKQELVAFDGEWVPYEPTFVKVKKVSANPEITG